MKKITLSLLALVVSSFAYAVNPTVFTQAGGDNWVLLEQQLVAANAIKDGRIEVPVLGFIAHATLVENGQLNELPKAARSEEGVIRLLQQALGGNDVAVEDFKERARAGGITLASATTDTIVTPADVPTVSDTRTAEALAALAATQDALRQELAKLAQERTQAAASQRAEVAKLQREIAGMESELKAQTANQGKRLGESLAAAAAARNALEERVKAATDKALTLTGRVLEVQKQVTALEAAPIVKNGNYVMGAIAVLFLCLVAVGGLFATHSRRIMLAEKLARRSAEVPAEMSRTATTAYVMASEAQLTAQNAQSDVDIAKAVANEAKTIAGEAKQGVEKLRSEVLRDIEIPDNLRSALRELTTDNPSHRATVSVDEQSFTLSFVFAEEGKVFIRGVRDQENAVAIDRVPSVIRRAARDGRVIGWEAMQQRKDPAPKPTVLRQVQPPNASEDSLLARAAARARPTEVDVLIG